MSHKILVVDDEPIVSGILEQFLSKLGYEVAIAESGQQAIDKIAREPFALVLCDVMMPGMDGLETLARIKEIDNSLPVIMMSGLGTHDRVIKALEKDAIDFIAKPIHFNQAKKIIQQVLITKPDAYREPHSSLTHLLQESYLGLLRLVVHLLEAKSPYLKNHSTRVAEYAVKTAQALQIPEDTIEVINYGGILHDIGKIGISDVILAKPAKLNEQEWAEVKMHPTIGTSIVSELKLFRPEEPLIRHHHEWYNGTGYPLGLAKDEIPLGARIIGIADAYDAMTSARPYRTAFTSETAKQRIKDNIGKQFDPEISKVFLSVVS